MTSEPILTHFEPPEDCDGEAYDKAVEAWLKIKDEDEREAFYRTEVFPRSCSRLRAQAEDDIADLLFVPIGTQSYAPILACIANPAQVIVLLHSESSYPYAQLVEATLASEGHQFKLVRIQELDVADIAEKMQSCYDSLGQPEREGVICDQTGGTKVMTAAVAGVAAVNGWTQTYIASTFIQKGGSHHESRVVLDNLFDKMGGWHRGMAWRLASLGQFEAGADALRKAAEESLASRMDRVWIENFELAAAFRAAKVELLRRRLKSKSPLPPETLELLHGDDLRGLNFWIARTLAREGQALASCYLLHQIGVDAAPATLKSVLAGLEKERKVEWQLNAWKPLDFYIGSGLTAEAKRNAAS